MAIEKVLVVDDELIMRDLLAEILQRQKIEVATAENGRVALKLIKDEHFDLIITDMKMPGMTGLELLKQIKELHPEAIIVVITAFGSIDNAVEAMQLGAFDYLLKPFSADSIEAMVNKAGEHLGLVEENHCLRHQISHEKGRRVHRVIANSPLMKELLSDVERIAASNANVFITGESGTGKEVIAQAIHDRSMRANRSFIKVNCAAIPETLIESEFFGHEKGAFTGANAKRSGRFELANSGTLLLDEVSEIPLMMQAKLLRAIQEHEFERVGGTKPVKVDVRLISTSNRVIQELISQNVLRKDLYYRLNVVPIYIAPLRERQEDIFPLSEYFLERLCLENHKTGKKLTEKAKNKLLNYSWPGNVRELANILERAVVMDKSPSIGPEQLYLGE